jgi:hypothetical protein
MAANLDDVRARCAEVAGRAHSVHIHAEEIAPYARSLSLRDALSPQLDPAHHYLGNDADTLAFVVTLDTINFGSGYFPHLRKLPGLSGYFTVATYLTEAFRRHGPYSAQELCNLDASACVRVFHQDPADEAVAELMSLFARALNDLGQFLLERFTGSFVGLIEAAGGSVERLVTLLAEMPFFQDVEQYVDLQVPFYKRAQLTAADLALAFDRAGYGTFSDLDRLTIFADNLVPHVLRCDGILRYDDDLARRIEVGELIPVGSPEEVEIRACAVHVVELIAQVLREDGQAVNALGLDYLLWNRGQEPAYKARPRHRTRTVFY